MVENEHPTPGPEEQAAEQVAPAPAETKSEQLPPYVEIEQRELQDFTQKYGEKLFGIDKNAPPAEQEVGKTGARQFLNESLTAFLVFSSANRELRAKGVADSVDTVKDPLVRLQALRDAQKRIELTTNEIISSLLARPTQELSGKNQLEMQELRPDQEAIHLIQYLLRGDHQNSLRAKFGLSVHRALPLSAPNVQFLTNHLNEINLVHLAQAEDKKSQEEGRRGQLFGKPSKADPHWLPDLMKMNGFLTTPDGLMVPSEMDPADQEKYTEAFEAYRHELTEHNQSSRHELNERELALIAEAESLISEHEELDSFHTNRFEHADAVEKTAEWLGVKERELSEAKQLMAQRQVALGEKRFFKGGQQRAYDEAASNVNALQQDVDRLKQQLEEKKQTDTKAKTSQERREQIARTLKERGLNSDPALAKASLAERKQQPKY